MRTFEHKYLISIELFAQLKVASCSIKQIRNNVNVTQKFIQLQ